MQSSQAQRNGSDHDARLQKAASRQAAFWRVVMQATSCTYRATSDRARPQLAACTVLPTSFGRYLIPDRRPTSSYKYPSIRA
jgi:hypothetical protein